MAYCRLVVDHVLSQFGLEVDGYRYSGSSDL